MVAYTGLSLHRYLTRYRIDRAVDLLSTTTMSVSEVGAAVGFPDPSHFSKAFEKVIGHPPSAFRA
jgi:transcriptional regulator GlxA family with amidase domain